MHELLKLLKYNVLMPRDLLMTGSMDEVVKVWDLQGGQPTFVTQKNMGIGNIYTLASCPDVPYVFCAGGSRKDNYLYLWDSRESDSGIHILGFQFSPHSEI